MEIRPYPELMSNHDGPGLWRNRPFHAFRIRFHTVFVSIKEYWKEIVMLGKFDHPLILRSERRMELLKGKPRPHAKGEIHVTRKIHAFKYEIDSDGSKELR